MNKAKNNSDYETKSYAKMSRYSAQKEREYNESREDDLREYRNSSNSIFQKVLLYDM